MKTYFDEIATLVVKMAENLELSAKDLNNMKDDDGSLVFGIDYENINLNSDFYYEERELVSHLNNLMEKLRSDNISNVESDMLKLALLLQSIGNYFIYLNNDIRSILYINNLPENSR